MLTAVWTFSPKRSHTPHFRWYPADAHTKATNRFVIRTLVYATVLQENKRREKFGSNWAFVLLKAFVSGASVNASVHNPPASTQAYQLPCVYLKQITKADAAVCSDIHTLPPAGERNWRVIVVLNNAVVLVTGCSRLSVHVTRNITKYIEVVGS